MQILAHRGWWKDPTEKNSEVAFRRAFESNYGVETDVRDLNGELVISHDPPTLGAMTLEAFLDLYQSFTGRPKLALNVKADGLANALQAQLAARGIENYFVFDMSVPDSLHYFRLGMPVFTRRSEYETESPLDGPAAGFWLDSFTGAADISMMATAIVEPKGTALVSPELHRRPHMSAWITWRAHGSDVDDRVALCTDFPGEADLFFNSPVSAEEISV